MDDEATLQTRPHRVLRHGLKFGRVPAADFVAENLRFEVFALVVMQDRGDRFVADTGGAVAENFHRARSGCLIARDCLPATPDNNTVHLLLEDQRGVWLCSRLGWAS